jgi:hypothetical protein
MFKKLPIGLLCLLVVTSGFLAGCDSPIDSEYKEQLVVTGYLFADAPIDSVIVHRTTPFGVYLDDLASAIDSAIVIVTVDGKQDTLLRGARKGRYYLPASTLIVESGKTYGLTVRYHEHLLTASTRVPQRIHFTGFTDSIRGATVVYDTNNLRSFVVYMTAGPQDESSRRYALEIAALDTTQGRVHPPATGAPVDSSTVYARYSQLYTAPNIPVDPRLVAWFGANKVSFLALDSNWADERRMNAFGGARASYQPSLNHMNGGIGVWGSSSRDTMTVYVKPPK